MERHETETILDVVEAAYNSFSVNERRIDVWHKYFKKSDFNNVIKKLDSHIRFSNVAPTISELLEFEDKFTE